MADEIGTRREARALAIFLMAVVAALMVIGVSWFGLRAVVIARTPVPPIYELAEETGLVPDDLIDGWTTYAGLCAVCHGKHADGIPKLGKPLRNNEFIQSLSDEELTHFIAEGRLPTDERNTTGVPMPPRGGNPKLSDARIERIVRYLRTIQDPNAPPPDLSPWIVERDDSVPSGPGHDAFVAACSSCHGPDAKGMPGLGKDLRSSKFVASKTDEELMKFIKTGRPMWDSENTTGVDMPPKGGNPALKDDEIELIIQFIRSVHE